METSRSSEATKNITGKLFRTPLHHASKLVRSHSKHRVRRKRCKTSQVAFLCHVTQKRYMRCNASTLVGDYPKHRCHRQGRKISQVTLCATPCHASKLVRDDCKHWGRRCNVKTRRYRYVARPHHAAGLVCDDSKHLGRCCRRTVILVGPHLTVVHCASSHYR